MAHLRMDNSAIVQRSADIPRLTAKAEREYFFTRSHWDALSFLSVNGGMVLEAGYVDPNTVFPYRVMRQVDYGIKFGLTAYVTKYIFVLNNKPAGAILSLKSGSKEIGHFAIRF